jgi:hypothetical protein
MNTADERELAVKLNGLATSLSRIIDSTDKMIEAASTGLKLGFIAAGLIVAVSFWYSKEKRSRT